jgi:DNA gyrase subunit A
MVVLGVPGEVLTICENGYGKRTDQAAYPRKHRGGMGVRDIRTSERNGAVVASLPVGENDEVLVVTQNGIVIRVPVAGISAVGRNTQGVKVINLDPGDRVIDFTRVEQSPEEAGEEGNGSDQPLETPAEGAESEVPGNHPARGERERPLYLDEEEPADGEAEL